MTSRRLAAVLAADAVDFTQRTAVNETAALAAVRACLEMLEQVANLHGGRVFKTIGDGLLAEFGSVVNAVTAAAAMQSRLSERNRDLPDSARFAFRIGVHAGDVVVDGHDILGEGVNLAARLESAAAPGGVLVSDRVHADVAGKLDFAFADCGVRSFKGMPRPVRVYGLMNQDHPAVAATPPALPEKPSLVVLPFINMSSEQEQEYFADGLTEDIITAFASVPWIFVIARNSSFTYKGMAVDVRNVGRDLGVRYILEGSVRRSGRRLRVTGQLSDAETGAQLWVERLDGLLEDVFDFQDKVTEAVVAAITPQIQGAEIARAAAKRPESLTAYDYMLRAMASLNRADVSQAMQHLDRALELAPDYGKALALRAWCLTLRSAWADASSFEAGRPEGCALARRAIDVAAGDPEAEAYAGYALGFFGDDLASAFRLLKGAVERCPSFVWAWTSIAMLEGLHGDPDRSLEACDRAARLNPRDPMAFRIHSARASALQAKGDWAALVEEVRRVVGMMPNLVWTQAMLVASLGELGRLAESRDAATALRQRFPEFSTARMVSVFRKMRNTALQAEWIEKRLLEAGLPA